MLQVIISIQAGNDDKSWNTEKHKGSVFSWIHQINDKTVLQLCKEKTTGYTSSDYMKKKDNQNTNK